MTLYNKQSIFKYEDSTILLRNKIYLRLIVGNFPDIIYN